MYWSGVEDSFIECATLQWPIDANKRNWDWQLVVKIFRIHMRNNKKEGWVRIQTQYKILPHVFNPPVDLRQTSCYITFHVKLHIYSFMSLRPVAWMLVMVSFILWSIINSITIVRFIHVTTQILVAYNTTWSKCSSNVATLTWKIQRYQHYWHCIRYITYIFFDQQIHVSSI